MFARSLKTAVRVARTASPAVAARTLASVAVRPAVATAPLRLASLRLYSTFNDSAAPAEIDPAQEAESASRTVFVGGLSFGINEDWLASEFSTLGEVVSARIITDKFSGRSKGFGYVEFASAEDAQKALSADGKSIDNRPVRVDIATPRQASTREPRERAPRGGDRGFDRAPRQANPPSSSVYVGNLPYEIGVDEVAAAFESFGNVKDVRLIKDRETGRGKGFGYVEMGSVDEASAAVESGLDVGGRAVRLDFASERREPREGGFNRGPRRDGGGGGYGGSRGGYGGGRGGYGGGRGGYGGGGYGRRDDGY